MRGSVVWLGQELTFMVAEDLHTWLSVGIVGWLETKLGDTYTDICARMETMDTQFSNLHV